MAISNAFKFANNILTNGGYDAADLVGAAGGGANFKNIVINGDMQIAQRSTSVASITTGSAYDTVDRFQRFMDSAGTWTISQSTDVPTGEGFAKSLKFDCTTANGSLSSTSEVSFWSKFEGQNLQYLKKGTANAQSLTLSFWVKSTKTGTFISNLFDQDNSRIVSKSYTVNTTNTWEKKTLTFPADATGAFDNDNGGSLLVRFWLVAGTFFQSGTLDAVWGTQSSGNYAVGQVNCADSTSNDFLITGVQLEAGTSATDFEFLPYDVSLERCLRYYEKSYSYGTAVGTASVNGLRHGSTTSAGTTGYLNHSLLFACHKRAAPSLTIYDNSGNSGKCSRGTFGVGETNNSNVAIDQDTEKSAHIYSNTGSNHSVIYYHFQADSEL